MQRQKYYFINGLMQRHKKFVILHFYHFEKKYQSHLSYGKFSQTGVIFIWNSQNDTFFYLFSDMDKSFIGNTISLWRNRDLVTWFNLRLNEIVKREHNFSLLDEIVQPRF